MQSSQTPLASRTKRLAVIQILFVCFLFFVFFFLHLSGNPSCENMFIFVHETHLGWVHHAGGTWFRRRWYRLQSTTRSIPPVGDCSVRKNQSSDVTFVNHAPWTDLWQWRKSDWTITLRMNRSETLMPCQDILLLAWCKKSWFNAVRGFYPRWNCHYPSPNTPPVHERCTRNCKGWWATLFLWAQMDPDLRHVPTWYK